jgi:type IV pilus assembly protein PilB
MQRKSSMKRTVKDQSGAGKIKIGELLSKAGQITPTQLETAKKLLQKNGGRLSSILRQLDYIDENTVFNFLSRQHNYPAVVIKNEPPSKDVLKLLPYETAKDYMAFPLRIAGNILQITMAEPSDSAAVEELQDIVKRELNVCVSTEKDIVEAYQKYYGIDENEARQFFVGQDDDVEEELDITQVDDFGSIVAEAADDFEIDAGDAEDGADQFAASDAPIIKLVNGILVKAVQDGVSDIHVEPYEKTMQVRYRKDGSLFKSMNLPLTIKNALVARMKILAGLDITERRVPQDGRIKMRMGRNRSVDFRVSSLPTLFGESVVLRILDKSSLNVDLTKLGFEVETFEMLKRCLSQPQGLLLVTGPAKP